MDKKYLKYLSVPKRYKFSADDEEIYEIYLKYSFYVRKYLGIVRKHLPEKKDPREASNWKYFKLIKDVCDEYNTIILEKYIIAQVLYIRNFSKNRICLPKTLVSKNCLNRYTWFLECGDSIKKSIDNISDIRLEIFKQNALFLHKQKLLGKYKNYKEMFLDKKDSVFPNIYGWVLFGKVDKLFLSISKGYADIYESFDSDVKDSMPSLKELSRIRVKVFLNERLCKFCRKVFKDESII